MKRSYLFMLAGLSLSLVLAGCTQSSDQEQESTAPTPTPTQAAQAPQVPPAQAASVSGTLKIEGAVVQNTTALFLQRKVGELTYTAFDRQPAVDGLEWSFDEAMAGQTYEITATLQVSEQDKATGSVVTVDAPASNQQLYVGSELNLPAPPSMPEVSCGSADNTGGFNATMTYPSVENAAGYYYQVGVNPGEDGVDKGAIKAEELVAPKAVVYVKANTDHYSRYAYTLCSDCNVYDTQNWSAWSPTLGFKCPAE